MKDPPSLTTPPEPHPPGGATRAFVDGIEGDTARLLMGEEVFEIPAALLPEAAQEGSWIEIAVIPPPADDTEERRRRLGADDLGGDIEL